MFSTEDYEALTKDAGYLRFLREVFANSNAVFGGYSVRDDYVVRSLLKANDERVSDGTNTCARERLQCARDREFEAWLRPAAPAAYAQVATMRR